MGAYFRFFERRIEKMLAEDAARGVRPAGPEQDDPALSGGRIRDRRQLVPALGLREYWYPALPIKRVPKNKPLYWRMLGDEIAFFRTRDDSIGAVSDVCPHRGASMSRGFCFYKGTISCPYHGATFDESGKCKAFLPEGPESKMEELLTIKHYPTRVLRGWVFVWMGEDAPAPIEEDVPPELFEGEEGKTHFLTTYTYWRSNWMVAIENQGDSHNYFYAHRNSLMQLTANRTRPRTPVGARSKLINDRALFPLHKEASYYADDSGVEPYQLYYPGVDGHWPIGQWRRWLWTLFKPWNALVYNKWRMRNFYKSTEEWASDPGIAGWHLPCMVRVNFGAYTLTRYSVAVTENLSRIVYFHHRRKAGWAIARLIQKLWFHCYFNWWLHYNFSAQDGDVAAPCRYWTPENLSSTDSHLMMLRKLVTERSRDVLRRKREAAPGAPPPGTEQELFEQKKDSGNVIATSLAEAASRTEAVSTLGFVTGGLRKNR